jgi:hypothetical protein
MDLDEAIKLHIQWKVKLRMAIFQKEPLDSDCIGRDDCCELGEWLHGEAKAKFYKLEAYAACLARHKAFHEEAGRIARAINAARYDEATELMKSSGPFARASSAVGLAISDLRNEMAADSGS